MHGMTERQENCELCSQFSCLLRIPQMPNIKTSEYKNNSYEKNKNPGANVREAISENAEILKQQKKEATSWEYEPK
jgi:hypothetical protein